ncbi:MULTISPECIES: Rid family hydrolase [Brucella/Ochrobactrum group]|uniref:Rid family hydrolase n=1 Tax=Brucella/Ochrobactrum group TaxID=2826938 RepID=UPI00207B8B82|nr:Rid family hydrolase [Brucella sp. NBRC 12950]
MISKIYGYKDNKRGRVTLVERIFTGAASEKIAGYAKAVIDGTTVYISGTTGRNKSTGQFPTNAGEQARNALADIDEVLRNLGASLQNAVASRVYVSDRTSAAEVTPVLGELFANICPTSTFLICEIPVDGAKVEIEITASLAAT